MSTIGRLGNALVQVLTSGVGPPWPLQIWDADTFTWQAVAGAGGTLEWDILTDGHGNIIFCAGDVIAVSTLVSG